MRDERAPWVEDADAASRRVPYGVEGQPLRAGDRTPNAPGLDVVGSNQKTRLFDVFNVAKHVVLIFLGLNIAEVSGILTVVKRYQQGLIRTACVLPKLSGANGVALSVLERAFWRNLEIG